MWGEDGGGGAPLREGGAVPRPAHSPHNGSRPSITTLQARREASSGSFLQGRWLCLQTYLQQPLRQRTGLLGDGKAPGGGAASSWRPSGGRSAARGSGTQVLRGPAARLPGDGVLREHRADAHLLPSRLVLLLLLPSGLLLSGPPAHCSRGWRATALSELAQSPSWATEWPRTEAFAPQGGRPGCQVALHLGDGDLGLSTLLSEGPGLRTPNGHGVEHTMEERGGCVPHGTCSGRGGGRPHQGSADLSRLRAPGVHAMFWPAALGLAPGRR